MQICKNNTTKEKNITSLTGDQSFMSLAVGKTASGGGGGGDGGGAGAGAGGGDGAGGGAAFCDVFVVLGLGTCSRVNF